MSDLPFALKCSNCNCLDKSLFKSLQAEELDVLDSNKSCIRFHRGDIIFEEGAYPKGLFCIKKGVVKVYKNSEHGKEQILFLSQPGDFLGYRALISEEKYLASAAVLEEASICFIPKEDFLKILHSSPEFFNKMMKKVCEQLGIMQENLTIIAQKSVKERLATTLLMLKETYGLEGEGESSLIDIHLSREEIASVVGTATETIIRLLANFKSLGVIEFDGKKIRVINEGELKRLALAS